MVTEGSMADPQHVEVLKEGVTAWANWRKNNPDVKPDLSGINISDVIWDNSPICNPKIDADEFLDLFSQFPAAAQGAHFPAKEELGEQLRKDAREVVRLDDVNFEGVDLRQANLSRVSLGKAQLSGANFEGANLAGAVLNEATITGANFNQCHLAKAQFEKADLTSAKLRDTVLTRANFREADLTDADLTNASAEEANWFDVTLRRAVLRNAALTRGHFGGHGIVVEFLHRGPSGSLRRRRYSEADLSDADLSGASLQFSNLCRANFEGAVADEADFSDADLSGANLARARLRSANFSNTKLSNSRLERADLLDVRSFEVDESYVRDANLGPAASDKWSILRRTYTGPKMMVNLALVALFFAPLIAQASVLGAISDAQAAALQALATDPISVTCDQADGGAISATVNGSKISLPCRTTSVFSILSGLESETYPLMPVLTFILITYQLLRYRMTVLVSEMRDAEERSGISPPLKANGRFLDLVEAPTLDLWWSWLTSYPQLYRAHLILRGLELVAIAAFIIRFVELLATEIVLRS